MSYGQKIPHGLFYCPFKVWSSSVGGSDKPVLFKISYAATVNYLHYVQPKLIFNILTVGVELSPLVCSQLMGSFSVSEKLDVVHQVYDRRGGPKYTCTLQN